MAYTNARHEFIRSHGVSIFFVPTPENKGKIQPVLLKLVHAGLPQRGIPVGFPGPFLRQAMSR